MHSDQNSLTEGPIAKKILLFALPLFIGNLFQLFYNLVDSIVVGDRIKTANGCEQVVTVNYKFIGEI